MMNNSESILVLGSRHGCNLPDLKVKMVFSSNASATKAKIYKEKYSDVPLVCCTTVKEFTKNDIVKNAIMNSLPNKIIVRGGEVEELKKLSNCKVKFMSHLEQRKFQSNFYKYKKISFFLGEMRYRRTLKKTLSYFYHRFLNNSFLGASTGLFSILLALSENENSNIIISGIGLDGGPHFYKSDREVDQDHSPRARVDQYLINAVESKYKKRIMTLDKEMAKDAQIRFWEGKVIT